jgi:putative transposase
MPSIRQILAVVDGTHVTLRRSCCTRIRSAKSSSSSRAPCSPASRTRALTIATGGSVRTINLAIARSRPASFRTTRRSRSPRRSVSSRSPTSRARSGSRSRRSPTAGCRSTRRSVVGHRGLLREGPAAGWRHARDRLLGSRAGAPEHHAKLGNGQVSTIPISGKPAILQVRRFSAETPPPPWHEGARSPAWVNRLVGTEPTFADLCNRTRGHATRIGMSSIVVQSIIRDACRSWTDYRAGRKGKPRFKGGRNRLASLPIAAGVRFASRRSIVIPVLGEVRMFGHSDAATWVDAKVGLCRLRRRPRGWYISVSLECDPRPIRTRPSEGAVGIDLGFLSLATLSTGEVIPHPQELQTASMRLAQASRGRNLRLAGRLEQRLANARRHRNHRISADLVSRFRRIYVSEDNLRLLQRGMGRASRSAAHGQLIRMLEVKCRQAGREFVSVPCRNSTRTCSSCQSLSGPAGLLGLRVRRWTCEQCGAQHDRDINAAVNTLFAGAVLALEGARNRVSETRKGNPGTAGLGSARTEVAA